MPRPRITLKLATSLDGQIALANGQSEWITGEKARTAGRRLRAEHDGIAVGSNTAVLDNPQLTARLDGEADPVRVIFDSRARLPLASNLAQTARSVPVILFCMDGLGSAVQPLVDLGVQVLPIPYEAKLGLDIGEALTILHRQGMSSLLVEGGGTLAASFMRGGFIDRIEWFRSSLILGGDGRPGIGNLNLTDLSGAPKFERIDVTMLGDDLHERYERRD